MSGPTAIAPWTGPLASTVTSSRHEWWRFLAEEGSRLVAADDEDLQAQGIDTRADR